MVQLCKKIAEARLKMNESDKKNEAELAVEPAKISVSDLEKKLAEMKKAVD